MLKGYFYIGLIIAFEAKLPGQTYLFVMQWLNRFEGLTGGFLASAPCRRKRMQNSSFRSERSSVFYDSASMSIEITLMGWQCNRYAVPRCSKDELKGLLNEISELQL